MQSRPPDDASGPGGHAALEVTGRVGCFRREGEYWTIARGGATLRLRDTKGLRYLAHLLRHPGERLAAADLLSAAAPGGRGRAAAGRIPEGERARLAVTKRIKSAIRKIAEHDSSLGYHLNLAVKTGSVCVYLPDPERPIAWKE